MYTNLLYSRLVDGDCGSVVYVRSKRGNKPTRIPFAMFIGEFTGAHTLYCDVYQAILLPHAIADLEADYPNHVSELYQFAHDKHQIAHSPVNEIISQLDSLVDPPAGSCSLLATDPVPDENEFNIQGLRSRAEGASVKHNHDPVEAKKTTGVS